MHLRCGGGSPWGGGLVWRGVVLLGLVVVVLVITPVAFAQSQTPEAPTAVAVYSIDFRTMEVRWSSSDAASTTSFKIQWKSGSQEFDSSRQVSSDPSTSVVIEQSRLVTGTRPPSPEVPALCTLCGSSPRTPAETATRLKRRPAGRGGLRQSRGSSSKTKWSRSSRAHFRGSEKHGIT